MKLITYVKNNLLELCCIGLAVIVLIMAARMVELENRLRQVEDRSAWAVIKICKLQDQLK